MNIDLTILNSNTVEEININETVNIPKKYFENSDVKELNDIKITGTIKKGHDNEIRGILKIDGKMMLEDAISLDDVYYKFNIDFDDEIKINEQKVTNSLDLYEFLWENIVLEVPQRYTEVEDISDLRGSGWSLVDEKEKEENPDNPFLELLNKMEKE